MDFEFYSCLIPQFGLFLRYLMTHLARLHPGLRGAQRNLVHRGGAILEAWAVRSGVVLHHVAAVAEVGNWAAGGL